MCDSFRYLIKSLKTGDFLRHEQSIMAIDISSDSSTTTKHFAAATNTQQEMMQDAYRSMLDESKVTHL